MLTATFDVNPAKSGAMYRAAKLAMLRHQVVHHIERTDALAQKVEQALERFVEANTQERLNR